MTFWWQAEREQRAMEALAAKAAAEEVELRRTRELAKGIEAQEAQMLLQLQETFREQRSAFSELKQVLRESHNS